MPRVSLRDAALAMERLLDTAVTRDGLQAWQVVLAAEAADALSDLVAAIDAEPPDQMPPPRDAAPRPSESEYP